MKPLSALAVALIIAAGLGVLNFFVGDGIHNIRSTGRYVNVRGLAEREVTADTARLSIHMERSGSSVAAIFPELAATQAQVQAFLAQQGIKAEQMQAGQWTTTGTSAQELKNDPGLPRYSVDGLITVTTHNIGAAQSASRQHNDLRARTGGCHGVPGHLQLHRHRQAAVRDDNHDDAASIRRNVRVVTMVDYELRD